MGANGPNKDLLLSLVYTIISSVNSDILNSSFPILYPLQSPLVGLLLYLELHYYIEYKLYNIMYNMKRCLILSQSFLTSNEIIMVVFFQCLYCQLYSQILLKWTIPVFLDEAYLSWCMIFLMCSWNCFVNILLSNLHVRSWGSSYMFNGL